MRHYLESERHRLWKLHMEVGSAILPGICPFESGGPGLHVPADRTDVACGTFRNGSGYLFYPYPVRLT